MKTREQLWAFLLCFLVSGCGTLLRVQRFDPNKPAGVPFYAKVGVCNHQSAYVNPYWRLTLKITSESGTQTQEILTISNAAYSGPDFNALLHELDKASADSDSVMNAWNDLKRRNSFDPWKAAGSQLLLENSSSLTSVVDYATKFSINQGKPFSGSANADFKLGADGTLNEASAQVQDNTFATIVSALPISSLITSAAGIATKSGAAANEPAKQQVKFALVQEQRYIKTVYARYSLADKPICTVDAALTDQDVNVAKTVSDIGGGAADNGNQDKTSDSIAISGTIRLPKSMLGASGSDSSSDGKKGSPSGSPDKSSAAPSSKQK